MLDLQLETQRDISVVLILVFFFFSLPSSLILVFLKPPPFSFLPSFASQPSDPKFIFLLHLFKFFVDLVQNLLLKAISGFVQAYVSMQLSVPEKKHIINYFFLCQVLFSIYIIYIIKY